MSIARTIRYIATRRRTLQVLLASTVVAMPAVAREFAPRPRQAFRQQSLNETLAALYGDAMVNASDAIAIKAADLAENGAVVPVKVETSLAGLRSIALVASKNPVPLIATFHFGETTRGFLATRVKLAESCELIAIADTANGFYETRKAITVTIGGCGV